MTILVSLETYRESPVKKEANSKRKVSLCITYARLDPMIKMFKFKCERMEAL